MRVNDFWASVQRIHPNINPEAVDIAFYLACRNMPSHTSDNYFFQEILLYIRIGYDFLEKWC